MPDATFFRRSVERSDRRRGPRHPPAEGPASEPTSPSAPNPAAEDVSAEGDPQSPTADGGAPSGLPRRRRRRRRRPPRQTDPRKWRQLRRTKPNGPRQLGTFPIAGIYRLRRRRRWPPPAPPAPSRAAARAGRRGGGGGCSSGGCGACVGVFAKRRFCERRRTSAGPVARTATPQTAPSAAAAPPRSECSRDRPGHCWRCRRSSRAGAPQYRSGPYRGSRSRGVRNRRSGDERPPERRPAGDNRRSPDRRAARQGPTSRDDRRQGRDRDAPSKRPEPRLYALEAIVDRGFEDVVDAAEDNLTRRVHWTIIKAHGGRPGERQADIGHLCSEARRRRHRIPRSRRRAGGGEQDHCSS